MNTLRQRLGAAAVVACGLLACGIASAAPILMNFDGMAHAQGGQYLDRYYDGGCGGAYLGGSIDCDGPDLGVEWKGLLVGGAQHGLWSDSANQPGGTPTVGSFLATNIPGTGAKGIMNVAAGFETGLAFYYAHPSRRHGNLRIWSGLDGTGTLLANVAIGPTTGSGCDGYSEDYSCWNAFGVAFSGIARSVTFLGQSNLIRFDNFTLGAVTPAVAVPEPAALGLFGFGVLLLGGFAALRRPFQG